MPPEEIAPEASKSPARATGRKLQALLGGKGGLLFAVSSTVVNFSNFLFHVIVSRALGPAGYGEVASLLNIASVLTLPFAALQATVVQQVVAHRNDEEPASARRLLMMASGFSVAFALVFVALSPLVAGFLALGTLLPVMTLAIYLSTNAALPIVQGTQIGRINFTPVAVSNLVGALVRLAAALVFAWLHFGVEGAVIATGLNAVVTLGMMLAWTRDDLRGHGARIRLPMRRLALALVGTTGAAALINVDTVVARHLLDPHKAGLYAAAATGARIALFLPAVVTTLVFPRLAADRGVGANARRNLMLSSAVIAVAGLSAAAGMAVLPHLVIGVLFGAKYQKAAGLLRILGVEATLLGLVNLLTLFHIARRSTAAWLPWIGVATSALVALVLHPSGRALALLMLVTVGGIVLVMTALALIAPDTTTPAETIPVLPRRELDSSGVVAEGVDLSLVVPHYNPGPRLVEHVVELLEVLRASDVTSEVIAVSDGSTDAADNALVGLGPEVRVIRLTQNMGKGMAVRIGLAHGRGRYLGFIDGDGDIPARVLAHFLEEVRFREPDFAIGSKLHPESRVVYPPMRRLYSRGYQLLTGLLFGLEVSDTQTGVKIAKREVLEAVLPVLEERGFAVDLEMLAVARHFGFKRVRELPIEIRDRVTTHITPQVVWTMLLDTFAIAWRLRVVHRYDKRRAASLLHPTHLAAPVIEKPPPRPPLPPVPVVELPPLPDRKLRILVCNWRDLTHPLSGGAEVWTQEVMASFVRMGHSVTLFTSAVEGQPERDTVGGVEVVRRGSRFSVYREARKYYETEGRGRFDLVIDEVNTKPFGAPKWANVPVLAVIHQLCREVWFYEMPLPVALAGRYLFEPAWLRAYRDVPVATLADSGRASLHEVGLRNVSVVPPGYRPVPEVSVDKETRPTLLYVGRLAHNKRPDHVIRAFALARAKVPDAQLWIVGRGPMAKELERKAPAGVTFFGAVSDHEKRELMAKAHALVMCSAREGWGLTVTEAAQMGTPTIAYDVAGLADSVSLSGGFVVPENIAELADAIGSILPNLAADPTWADVAPRGVLPWDAVAWDLLAVAGFYEFIRPEIGAEMETEASLAGAGVVTTERPARSFFSRRGGPPDSVTEHLDGQGGAGGGAGGLGEPGGDGAEAEREVTEPGEVPRGRELIARAQRFARTFGPDLPDPLQVSTATRRGLAFAGIALLFATAFTGGLPGVSNLCADFALLAFGLAALIALGETRLPEDRPRGLLDLKGTTWQWRTTGLLLVGGCALVCQTWFRPGTVLAHGDTGPPVGTAWISTLFSPFAWTSNNLGIRADAELKLIPALFQWTVNTLGGNAALSQRLFLTVLFALVPLATLYLARMIGLGPWAGALAAIGVEFNGGSVVNTGTNAGKLLLLIVITFMPAVILSVARDRMRMTTGIVCFALAAPAIGYLYSNPPLVLLPLVVVVLAAFIANRMGGREAGRRAFAVLLLGGLLLVVLSAYWLVPAWLQLHDAAVAKVSSSTSWLFTMRRATISNSFWLNDGWGFHFLEFYPYAPKYSVMPLELLRYGLAIVGLGSLALPLSSTASPNARRRIAVAATLGLMGLFLVDFATGNHFPGDLIFEPLYRLPYGWLLQTPDRFLVGAGICFALMCGLLFDALTEGALPARVSEWLSVRRPRRVATMAVVCAALAFIPGYPLVNGQVVPGNRPKLPPAHVKFPAYWLTMATTINRLPGPGAVLVLPEDSFYHVRYSWGYDGTDGFIENLLSKHVLDPAPQGYHSVAPLLLDTDHLVTDDLLAGKWSSAHQLLGVLRTPYLLVRSDVDWSVSDMTDPGLLDSALSKDPLATLVATKGKLALFRSIGTPSTGLVTSTRYATTTTTNIETADLDSLGGLPVAIHSPEPGQIDLTSLPPASEWQISQAALSVTRSLPADSGPFTLLEEGSTTSAPLADASTLATGLTSKVNSTATHPQPTTVTLSLPLGRNALPRKVAQNNGWGPVGNCAAGKLRHIVKLSARYVGGIAPNNGPALELSARIAEKACVSRRVYGPAGTYLLSFWAKRSAGIASPHVCLYIRQDRSCSPQVAAIHSTNDDWEQYTDVVTVPTGLRKVILYASVLQIGGQSVIDYADVQLRQLPAPLPAQLVIVGRDHASGSAPVLYTLGAAADQGWRAAKPALPVVVDGLLAGWLAPAGTAVRPTFEPAHLDRQGRFVSLGGLALAAGLLLVGVTDRSRRRRRLHARRRAREGTGRPLFIEVTGVDGSPSAPE